MTLQADSCCWFVLGLLTGCVYIRLRLKSFVVVVLVGEDADVVAQLVEGIHGRLKYEGNCNDKKQEDFHFEDRERTHWCLKIHKRVIRNKRSYHFRPITKRNVKIFLNNLNSASCRYSIVETIDLGSITVESKEQVRRRCCQAVVSVRERCPWYNS